MRQIEAAGPSLHRGPPFIAVKDWPIRVNSTRKAPPFGSPIAGVLAIRAFWQDSKLSRFASVAPATCPLPHGENRIWRGPFPQRGEDKMREPRLVDQRRAAASAARAVIAAQSPRNMASLGATQEPPTHRILARLR